MTNATIDNKVGNEAVVLWQYDKAYNLIALIGKFGEDVGIRVDGDPIWKNGELGRFNYLAKVTTEDFWNFVRDYVMPLREHEDETLDKLILTVWGRILGLSWPTYEEGGRTVEISHDFFRRIIRGRFFLLSMAATTANYNKYLGIVFPKEEIDEEAKKEAEEHGEVYLSGPRNYVKDGGTSMPDEDRWETIDNSKFMSMEFSMPDGVKEGDEEWEIIKQNPNLIYIYPAGIRYDGGNADASKVIGFDGQDLRNMANGFAWADENEKNGGILAGTDKAQFPQNERAN